MRFLYWLARLRLSADVDPRDIRTRNSGSEINVNDLILLFGGIALFAGAFLYVAACEALRS